MPCQLIIASQGTVESRNNIFLCKQGTQNGKFAWTGYLTVRIHDGANDATSLHASRSSRPAGIAGQQPCRNFIGLAEGDRTICMQHQRLKPLRRRIRIRAVFRNVEKRFVEVEGSLVESTKREVLLWAVGEQGRRVDNLTSHEVEFSALYFKVQSTLLKEQGSEGRSLITISSSPSSWLTGG